MCKHLKHVKMKKGKKPGILLPLCCMLLFCLPGHAIRPGISHSHEDGEKMVTIKGKVVDQDSLPLPGVTVLLKGTHIGTATDNSGRFSISVPDNEGAVLVFSFIGMESVEEEISNPRQALLVVMKETTASLSEVVKTGYYSTTKRRASGSIAVVTSESLENRIPTTIDNLLQGMVAGVAVTNTGRPGASSKIKIRGTNSIDGSTEPLWVVDGVPLQDELPEIDAEEVNSGNFNEIFMNGVAGINPSDIEDITILKDAAASAIYGSRAAGGVIVITTKQGKAGKTRVNYSARFGVGLQPQRDNNLMNSAEKLDWEEELWQEFGAANLAAGAAHVPVVGIVGMLHTDRIGKNAGAGSIVPITGFANSVASPAVEFKTEGYVYGMAAKMFNVAGPIIVFGVSAGAAVGLIYWLIAL